MIGLIEFTTPGHERPEQKVGNRTVPARSVPEAKFTVRADLIVSIAAPVEDEDYAEVRTATERWEIVETYGNAVALWGAALVAEIIVERVSDEGYEANGTAGSVPLTRCEAAVMVALTESPNVMVPFAAIAERIWGRRLADEHDRAAIRTHVHTLRRKMEKAGSLDRIVVIAGVGYKIVSAQEQPVEAAL